MAKSKTVTLTNGLNPLEKLQCCAWETLTGAQSCVFQIETDATGKVISRKRGANAKHTTFADAIAEMNKAVAHARALGWGTAARGYARQQTRRPPPPPRRPQPSPWAGQSYQQPSPYHCGEKCLTCRPPADDASTVLVPVFKDVDGAATAIINAGYKALAKIHHPDVGGSTFTMTMLSQARKQIRDMLDLVKP